MMYNEFYADNAVDILNNLNSVTVDLTVTSPPYENLRDYTGFSFDAHLILSAIYRVTKQGGICVWVVGDKMNGGRSLVSFEHAFIARKCGFIVHDVMIYQKKNTPFMRSNAYTNCYEFMLILSKGKPKTFNPIKVPTKRSGLETAVFNKKSDAINKKRPIELKKEKTKTNIWEYVVGLGALEKEGYLIPDRYMPDISLRRMFSKWLRENGYNPDNFQTYNHVFDDGKRPDVPARLYPNELMTSFNIELDKWIKGERSLKYFKERDKESIPYLEKAIKELPDYAVYIEEGKKEG